MNLDYPTVIAHCKRGHTYKFWGDRDCSLTVKAADGIHGYTFCWDCFGEDMEKRYPMIREEGLA